MTTFNVLVGVPSGQYWDAQFGNCLVNLVANFNHRRVSIYDTQRLRVANVRSSILSNNRLNLVKAAIREEATHLLFLDSDHTFPPDLIHKLAVHHRLVVAANCVTKTIPASPTARLKDSDPRGIPLFTDAIDTGLAPVWRIGTGVMLIKTSIFKQIGLDVWRLEYKEDGSIYQGEDWTFCAACEAAGIPLFIDHDVSKEIGHVGPYVYNHDVVGVAN